MDISNFFKAGYHRKPSFWVILAIILIIILWVKHHRNGSPRQNFTQSVVVSTAKRSDVPIYLSALGAVTPTHSVTVKAQVNGQLLRVLFREGQMVRKGDVLAEIDPTPYQALLAQYEGQLIRDKALLANAKHDLARYQKLNQKYVSEQTIDTQVSLVKQYEGTIETDKGLIASTQVNLNYCKIVAPIDGRIGLRLMDPGNIVQPNDPNGIAVINSLNPITVVFSIPEDHISQVVKQFDAGKKLLVKAYNRNQDKLLAVGTLETIDNQVDPSTGTVKLKAQFKNDEGHLFPSQFVNVQLLIETLQQVLVVPTAAIRHGIHGQFVYLLKADNVVKVVPVVVGPTKEDETVIHSGLLPGQSVVIEGVDKLKEGSVVKVTQVPQSTSQLMSKLSTFAAQIKSFSDKPLIA